MLRYDMRFSTYLRKRYKSDVDDIAMGENALVEYVISPCDHEGDIPGIGTECCGVLARIGVYMEERYIGYCSQLWKAIRGRFHLLHHRKGCSLLEFDTSHRLPIRRVSLTSTSLEEEIAKYSKCRLRHVFSRIRPKS